MTKKDGFVSFNDVASKRLEITTQGAYYYLRGLGGYPDLGKGLEVVKKFGTGFIVVDRDKNDSYYSWEMSVKDADEFVRRVEAYRKGGQVISLTSRLFFYPKHPLLRNKKE